MTRRASIPNFGEHSFSLCSNLSEAKLLRWKHSRNKNAVQFGKLPETFVSKVLICFEEVGKQLAGKQTLKIGDDSGWKKWVVTKSNTFPGLARQLWSYVSVFTKDYAALL